MATDLAHSQMQRLGERLKVTKPKTHDGWIISKASHGSYCAHGTVQAAKYPLSTQGDDIVSVIKGLADRLGNTRVGRLERVEGQPERAVRSVAERLSRVGNQAGKAAKGVDEGFDRVEAQVKELGGKDRSHPGIVAAGIENGVRI